VPDVLGVGMTLEEVEDGGGGGGSGDEEGCTGGPGCASDACACAPFVLVITAAVEAAVLLMPLVLALLPPLMVLP